MFDVRLYHVYVLLGDAKMNVCDLKTNNPEKCSIISHSLFYNVQCQPCSMFCRNQASCTNPSVTQNVLNRM